MWGILLLHKAEGFRLFLYCLNTSILILVLEVSNGAHTVSKISKGVVLSLHVHQNFLSNKVDIKLPIVSTKDPLFLGFYIVDITLGETPASLFDFAKCLFGLLWTENLKLLIKHLYMSFPHIFEENNTDKWWVSFKMMQPLLRLADQDCCLLWDQETPPLVGVSRSQVSPQI